MNYKVFWSWNNGLDYSEGVLEIEAESKEEAKEIAYDENPDGFFRVDKVE